MQYHALALALNGADVDLIGVGGSPLPELIARQPHITVHRLGGADARRGARSRAAYAALAVAEGLALSVALLRLLLRVPRPDTILVQNPPALPTLVVARLAAWLRRARLVVDWHNLGYRMLALRLGDGHLAVRAARWLEASAGRAADAHLCVSAAFSALLAREHAIVNARVFRDRPSSLFFALDDGPRDVERKKILGALGLTGDEPAALIVSPTSWTADEDTDLVLEAAGILETRIAAWEGADSSRRFPDLIVLLTGSGEKRDAFERSAKARQERRVRLRTHWFAADDYPRAIAAADLGVCLHRSVSGVDLPMKVADLFGAGVPVCALNYGPCLAEQIHAGGDGLLFTDAGELADQIFDLFACGDGASRLARLRDGVRRAAHPTWEEAWTAEARPLLV